MSAFNCKSVFEKSKARRKGIRGSGEKVQGSDRRAGKERVFCEGDRILQSPYGGNNGADKDGDPVARGIDV